MELSPGTPDTCAQPLPHESQASSTGLSVQHTLSPPKSQQVLCKKNSGGRLKAVPFVLGCPYSYKYVESFGE